MIRRNYKKLIEDINYYPLMDLEELGFKISKSVWELQEIKTKPAIINEINRFII